MKTDRFIQSRPYLPLRLQLFAEPPADPITPPDPLDPPADPAPPAEPTPPVKTYTQEELEDIIKQRISREKKASEKAIEEAKKLAKMNEDEKAKYEMEKLKEELAELKRKDAQYGLSKEASKMLADHDIQVDDELLAFVVKDDAEATKSAVDSFVALINAKVADGVKKALSGTAPKVAGRTGSAVTKESIMAEKDPSKRIRLIQEHPELF